MTELDPLSSPPGAAFEQARQAQAQAADPASSAWVEANAGSGKTKVLIDRVARLLLRRPDGRPGAAPDSILCVTYTRAAANEMLSRLFSRLGDWSIANDDALRASLAALEGRSPDDYDRDALKHARSLFASALETPGGLRIETIHAFCARILRRFPLEAGISPGFREIEDKQADALWSAVLSAQLEQSAQKHPEALRILSQSTGGLGANAGLDALKYKRQELAAFARSLGGADGHTLETRVQAALNAPQMTPEDILDTAMSKALPRAQIIQAVEELNQANRGKSDDKLFCALCDLLDETDPATQYTLYMDAISGSKQTWPDKSNPYTKAVPAGGAVIDLFSRDSRKGDPEGREITRMKAVQAELKAAMAAMRTIALLRIGLPMVSAYEHKKTLLAALDFDDLIEYTRRLLTSSDAAQWVLYKLDGGLSHILLDEAQDTSPPQWALINALVEEFRSGKGGSDDLRTQFVVGDPKQSIYSFQGADQQHFEAEQRRFVKREQAFRADINQPDMTMSFRSCPQILTFVDEVRARIPLADAATDRLPPRDADLLEHQPRRANQPGRVELWPLQMPQPGEQTTSDWEAPVNHIPQDAPRRRLAAEVARAIRKMIDRGETVWREDSNGEWSRAAITPQDILILVRSRNELFEALIENLKQQNLPVAGADRLKLLDNIGVQDCLNLIRFALQPADDLTLAEILRGPFCGLTDDNNHLFALAHARSGSLWNALENHSDPGFIAARSLCQDLIATRHLPAFDFLTRHLTRRREAGLSGWDRLVQRLGEPVREPVRALVNAALGHDMGEAASLQNYLAEIEGQATELKRDLGEPNGAIRVMTVHGAKGLQAPVVILPDTTGATRDTKDALFFSADGTPLYAPSAQYDCPITSDLREQKNLAGERESRRLLYVALTRACDRLIICGAGQGNNAAGYTRSAWYRWCLTAMRALNGEQTDDEELPQIPDEPLIFGADPPLTTPYQAGLETQPEAPAWLTRAGPEPAPPIRLAAPSRLLEDRARVAAPFGPGRRAALRRGRLIHTLLQTLPDVAPDARKAVAERFLKRDPETSPAERKEMLRVTLQTLEHPGFAAIFAPGGRNEAAIIGTLPSGQMVNGRVDRLIITATEVLIVDYKTDRPAPPDASQIGTAYIVQMAAYRAVLQQIFPPSTHKVRCALLYTDGPHLIELDGELMSEYLNRVKPGFDPPQESLSYGHDEDFKGGQDGR